MNKLFLLLSGLAMILVSCNEIDDLDGLQYDNTGAEFAIPIGEASFTMDELLNKVEDKTFLYFDPDGTIRLNYKGRLETKTSLEIFESFQAELERQPIIPITDTTIALPFALDSIDVDFMNLRKGQLILSLFNTQFTTYSVKWSFPSVAKGQDTLGGEFLVGPFGNFVDTIDLEGYTMAPNRDSIYFNYSATDLSTGDKVKFPFGIFNMFISNIEFSLFVGYFGRVVHESSPDTIRIDFFDNWTTGDIYFEEPKISIYSNNSFGVPTQAIIHYFDVNTINEGVISLQSPYIDNPPYFSYPSYPDELGETAVDTFIFDYQNSNMPQILGAGPLEVVYFVEAITNPDQDEDIRGFITENSEYLFIVEMDLPLYGRASGFTVTDTLDWELSGYDDITHAEFKIVSENELGVEVRLQGYFIDDNGQVLDSLFEKKEPVLSAAPVDDSGEVVGIGKSTLYSPFSAEEFDKIRSATKIVLSSEFFTTDNGQKSVRVKKDQQMNIRMGLKFGT
ncbi:MAG: hypothetical protein KDC24_04710 [Saprospiraceae bacterium]|nr:hypothetical protein [Saprospiraceae bacterium]